MMKSRREKLLRLSAVQFAAWELHLYLNTHPNDEQLTLRYKELEAEYQRLLSDFENEYGPIIMPATGNAWLEEPWPWETAKEGNK